MADNRKAIEIPITLTGTEKVLEGFRTMTSGIVERASALKGVGSSISSHLGAIGSTVGLLGAYLGGTVLRKGVDAFQETNVAASKLELALERVGERSKEVFKAFEDQAGAMETLTGIGDEVVMSVQAMLLSSGATIDTVKELVPLIGDLAAAMSIDMTAAARLVGAALDGQEINLGRFNIRAKSTADLIEQLRKNVGGQAAATHAARGGWGALSVSVENAEKALGKLVSQPASSFLLGVATGVENVLTKMDEWMERNSSLLEFVNRLMAGAGSAAGAALPAIAAVVAAVVAGHYAMKGLGMVAGVLGSTFTFLTGQAITPLLVAIQGLSAESGLAAAVFGTGATAASAFGVAIAGLVVAVAGFSLGKAISEIEVFGDTIQDRLVRGMLTAAQAWYMAKDVMGLATEEEKDKVEELGQAIKETGSDYRKQQAAAEEARRASRAGAEEARTSRAATGPSQKDLDDERARVVARGQTNLAVDREVLARGKALLEDDYAQRKVALDEYLAVRREQIAASYEMDLAEGLQKATLEKDANKARVLEESAFKLAEQKRLSAEQDLDLFAARERRDSDAIARATETAGALEAIEDAAASKREALVDRQERAQNTFLLSAKERRAVLIELDGEELAIIDDQITALQERLRLETDITTQGQIRAQIRGAQSERGSVARRKRGREQEADPESIRDQWDSTITSIGDRLNTVAQGIANTLGSVLQGAVDGIATSMQGLIYGTMSWGDALRNIGGSVMTALIGAVTKMFAEWILKMTLIRGLEALFSTQRKAEVATEIPLNVANSAAAAGSSYGTSAILGLVAFAALMAAALSFGGAFAKGGRPKKGALNLVGEEGPELFIPDTSGTIIPADRTASVLAGLRVGGSTAGSPSSVRREKRKEGSTSLILVDDRVEAKRHLRSRGGQGQVRDLVRGELMEIGLV